MKTRMMSHSNNSNCSLTSSKSKHLILVKLLLFSLIIQYTREIVSFIREKALSLSSFNNHTQKHILFIHDTRLVLNVIGEKYAVWGHQSSLWKTHALPTSSRIIDLLFYSCGLFVTNCMSFVIVFCHFGRPLGHYFLLIYCNIRLWKQTLLETCQHVS